MRDPKLTGLELLRERGQVDAARALTGVEVDLRHAGTTAHRPGEGRPEADLLLKAPHDLISCVRNGDQPQSDWGKQIEQALRDASGDDYDIRVVQWHERGSTTAADRPGTTGTGPSGGNARA